MKIIIIIMLLISGTANAQKNEVQKDTSYVLNGKLVDFNLLYNSVKSPRDVTPNQVEAILKWIETIKPVIDSTIKK